MRGEEPGTLEARTEHPKLLLLQVLSGSRSVPRAGEDLITLL